MDDVIKIIQCFSELLADKYRIIYSIFYCVILGIILPSFTFLYAVISYIPLFPSKKISYSHLSYLQFSWGILMAFIFLIFIGAFVCACL